MRKFIVSQTGELSVKILEKTQEERRPIRSYRPVFGCTYTTQQLVVVHTRETFFALIVESHPRRKRTHPILSTCFHCTSTTPNRVVLWTREMSVLIVVKDTRRKKTYSVVTVLHIRLFFYILAKVCFNDGKRPKKKEDMSDIIGLFVVQQVIRTRSFFFRPAERLF